MLGLFLFIKKLNYKFRNYFAFICNYISIKSSEKLKLNPKIIHIVFSYDRTLQLDNYIRSFKKYCSYDLNIDFYVIYKYSSNLHFN